MALLLLIGLMCFNVILSYTRAAWLGLLVALPLDLMLLAIFLRTGTRGQTAVDLARTLLSRFGGLKTLLAADRKAFANQLDKFLARR